MSCLPAALVHFTHYYASKMLEDNFVWCLMVHFTKVWSRSREPS